jgi:hypothetical protein
LATKKRFEGSAKPHLWRNSSKKARLLTGYAKNLRHHIDARHYYATASVLIMPAFAEYHPFAVNTSMKMGT